MTEIETDNLIKFLQQATTTLYTKIKKLITLRRRARPILQTQNLKKRETTLLKNTLSICQMKHIKNPKTAAPPIRKYSTPPGPWAKSDKEKADLFVEHFSYVIILHLNP